MHAAMSRQALRMLAVLVLLGAAAFPIYWMLVTSLTPTEALFADRPQLLPSLGQLPVYASVFAIKPVASWLFNSACVAIGTTVLSIALAVFPAYALSRFRFGGKGAIGFGLFATQMLPEARGHAVATFAATFFSGQAIGVLAAGYVFDRLGGPPIFAASALVLIALALRFSRKLAADYR